ncbi:MAG: Crp/Fnr family transcriptional regulator [Bacteroidia bacterium]|jgi:CRP/FNR family transcriptional regulator|nr:Crp/Fnr family transcriptional regulator [Bacteroidia bacterium]
MKNIKENDTDYICDITAPCFSNLSPQELAIVKSSRTQVKFRKGENLTKQGMFASYVLFLVNGVAKVYIEGDRGKNLNIRISAPGDFIGLSSVFTKGNFEYSTVCLSECHTMLVEKAAISSVCQINGSFATSIVTKYCQNNSILYSSLHTLLFNQMNGKMAKVLLYLNDIKAQHPDIFLLLSRKEIADFAGISTENAIKVLKALEKDKIIQLRDKDIVIIDKHILKELSAHG